MNLGRLNQSNLVDVNEIVDDSGNTAFDPPDLDQLVPDARKLEDTDFSDSKVPLNLLELPNVRIDA
jgi:hypothetical protein